MGAFSSIFSKNKKKSCKERVFKHSNKLLSDLQIIDKLLLRNADERIEFEEFF